MANVRLSDIAQKLELDISTVSRALRHDPRVKHATREIVQRAAQQFGYRPNLTAKNLAEGRTSTIWLLVPDLETAVEREPSSHASLWFMQRGFDLLIAQFHNSPEVFSRMLNRLDQGRADGALIIPSATQIETDADVYFGTLRVPFIFLDRRIPGVQAPLVTSDNEAIAYRLLMALVKETYGPQKIRWVLNSFFSARNSAESLRSAGVLRAARDAGLLVIEPLHLRADSVPDGPGAVVGTNQFEVLAIEGIGRFCSHVGVFDEWRGSANPFSTVHVAVQDFRAMAHHASELLLSAVELEQAVAMESKLIGELAIQRI